MSGRVQAQSIASQTSATWSTDMCASSYLDLQYLQYLPFPYTKLQQMALVAGVAGFQGLPMHTHTHQKG